MARLGDFNALTLPDYDEEYMAEVAAVRSRNRWEQPLGTVTEYVRELGFLDAKEEVGAEFHGELSTCR